jgi:hypothetical protein
MKRLTTAALALALGAFLTTPASAQERNEKPRKWIAAEKIDKTDDGKIGPLEKQRAKAIGGRIDRNDDGRVRRGGRKSARAKRQGLRERADRNDDGRVGRIERQGAKKRVQSKQGDGGCKGKGDQARGKKRGQRGGEGRGRGQGSRGGKRGAGRGRSV